MARTDGKQAAATCAACETGRPAPDRCSGVCVPCKAAGLAGPRAAVSIDHCAAHGSFTTCTYPLPCPLQTGKLRGTTLGPTLRGIYHTEGLPGLFRGNGASVLRIVPYAAVHFWCYEHYRRLLVAAEVLGAQVRLGRLGWGAWPRHDALRSAGSGHGLEAGVSRMEAQLAVLCSFMWDIFVSATHPVLSCSPQLCRSTVCRLPWTCWPALQRVALLCFSHTH